MEEIIGIVLLIGIIIMCLPIVGFFVIVDGIQNRKFKKIQRNGGLDKNEWGAGEKE